MNKEFIPYEQALELKELGFNELCLFYYTDNESLRIYHQSEIYDDLVGAPLYQQAFRWFREKYNFTYSIGKTNISVVHVPVTTFLLQDNATFEDAELATIKKFIEIAKQK
jgi:hypothetical protein